MCIRKETSHELTARWPPMIFGLLNVKNKMKTSKKRYHIIIFLSGSFENVFLLDYDWNATEMTSRK